MTHEAAISKWVPTGAIGVEIGAGVAPLPGFAPAPIYVDCFKAFGAEPCRADYYGHATKLPFHDHSLDYVAASHVLEHVANPVAALAEWYRVVRPGGIIYLVVPDRRKTWDHPRPLTTVEHMLGDFLRRTTACDATHMSEFASLIDWSRFNPATPDSEIHAKREELARGLRETIARGEDINIHFHTFEATNVRALLETLTTWIARRFNWEILEVAEDFPANNPNGILAVLRVQKGWRARADAEVFRMIHGIEAQAALREDAEPFATWAARTEGLGGVR